MQNRKTNTHIREVGAKFANFARKWFTGMDTVVHVIHTVPRMAAGFTGIGSPCPGCLLLGCLLLGSRLPRGCEPVDLLAPQAS